MGGLVADPEVAEATRFRLPPEPPSLWILYCNHRKEIRWREIQPQGLVYGRTDHHGDEGHWLLLAIDVERRLNRNFKMTDIIAMTATRPDPELDAAAPSHDGEYIRLPLFVDHLEAMGIAMSLHAEDERDGLSAPQRSALERVTALSSQLLRLLGLGG
jgi:hypothetical protein